MFSWRMALGVETVLLICSVCVFDGPEASPKGQQVQQVMPRGGREYFWMPAALLRQQGTESPRQDSTTHKTHAITTILLITWLLPVGNGPNLHLILMYTLGLCCVLTLGWSISYGTCWLGRHEGCSTPRLNDIGRMFNGRFSFLIFIWYALLLSGGKSIWFSHL